MAMPQQQMNMMNMLQQQNGGGNPLSYQSPQSTGGKYNFFTGTTAKQTQIPKFNQQQQQGFSQALQQALSGLQQQQQNPGAGFEPFAQKARTQFNTQTVPGIAERFESLGSGSDRGGGSLAGQLGAASAGLEENLAALGGQYSQQQQQLLQQLLGLGLTEQNENIYEPEKQSDFMNILMSLISAGGQAGGAALAAMA